MGKMIASNGDYNIYKESINGIGNERINYYVAIPYGTVEEYEMFLAFPHENFNMLSDTDVINEIKKVIDGLMLSHKHWVYVLPDISHGLLEEAALENDDRMYNDIFLNKISPVTSCVYAMLNKKVNNKINLIKHGDASRKFIHWISIQYAKNGIDAIREVEFDDFYKEENKKNAVALSTNESEMPSGQNDGGIAPVNHEFDNLGVSNSQAKVKTLKAPKHGSSGFSSVGFILAVLLGSLVFGIGIGCLFIK